LLHFHCDGLIDSFLEPKTSFAVKAAIGFLICVLLAFQYRYLSFALAADG
jgi:hypothetical protein